MTTLCIMYKSVINYTLGVLLCLILASPQMFAQGGRKDEVVFRNGIGIAGVSVAVCAPLATTAANVTSNLATFTMASNPQTAGFKQGMQVLVAGFTGGDTYFNAGIIVGNNIISGYTILSVTTTQVIVTLVHGNASASSNGTLLQQGNSTTSCAGLATLYTDSTLGTQASNPVTSDSYGNFGYWAPPGQYYIQYYGPTVTTTIRFSSIACVPQNTTNCGALLGTPNTWTALQTFSSGITSSGPNTLNGGGVIGGTYTGTPTLSGVWTFNAGLTSVGTLTTQNVSPSAAGTYILGNGPTPYFEALIGLSATAYTGISSSASTPHLVNFPDAAGTVVLNSSGNLAVPGTIGGTTPAPGTFTTVVGNSGFYNSGPTLFVSSTTPSIAGAGCGGSAASIPKNNGTAAFQINIGTSNSGTCTVTMPAASGGIWSCFATNLTTKSTNQATVLETSASNGTTLVLQNYTDVMGTHVMTDSDVLQVGCLGD